MRLLLDTHVLFWALMAPSALSATARVVLADESNDVLVSIASIWEISIKVGSGKWPEAADLLHQVEDRLGEAGFLLLPIAVDHVRTAGLIQSAHRDPFDRLLAAQARVEGLTVVSADPMLAQLNVAVLW